MLMSIEPSIHTLAQGPFTGESRLAMRSVLSPPTNRGSPHIRVLPVPCSNREARAS